MVDFIVWDRYFVLMTVHMLEDPLLILLFLLKHKDNPDILSS